MSQCRVGVNKIWMKITFMSLVKHTCTHALTHIHTMAETSLVPAASVDWFEKHRRLGSRSWRAEGRALWQGISPFSQVYNQPVCNGTNRAKDYCRAICGVLERFKQVIRAICWGLQAWTDEYGCRMRESQEATIIFLLLRKKTPTLRMSKKLAWLQVVLYLYLLREEAKYLIKKSALYDQADICEASGGLYEISFDKSERTNGQIWWVGMENSSIPDQKVLLCANRSCRIKMPQKLQLVSSQWITASVIPSNFKTALILLAFRWACPMGYCTRTQYKSNTQFIDSVQTAHKYINKNNLEYSYTAHPCHLNYFNWI